jgi:hypothetical protein
VEIKRYLSAARAAWNRVGDGVLALALFAASLALYTRTLAPSVATLFDDSLEFPLVAHRLAIAHPTGYPLYTLLAKVFSLLSSRTVAGAVNYFSAVAAALTVALVYLVTRHWTRRRLPALLGAVFLAVSPVFWSQSVLAEVYTLNSAFVAALLWGVWRWARRPLLPVEPFSLLQVLRSRQPMLFLPASGLGSRLPPGLRRAAYRLRDLYRRILPPVPPKHRFRPHPGLYALAALYGLSLAHHRSMLLLAPALLVFALLVEPRLFSRASLLGPEHPDRPRWLQIVRRPVVLLALAFLVPLLLYLYLPLRGHVGSLDGAYTNTWSGFWQWVTASGYNVFLGENPLARDLNATFYAGLFWRQFGPLGLALAILGVAGLSSRALHTPRRGSTGLVLSGLAFVAYAGFAILYRVPDVEVFFLPAFLIVSICIGVGLDYAAHLLRLRGPSLALRRLLAVSLVLLFLASIVSPLVMVFRHGPDLDLSRRWDVHDFGRYVLEQPLPANSTVVGLLGEMTLLRYFQETGGLRPDIETIAADEEGARLEAVEAALARGRSVYLTRPLPGLDAGHTLDTAIGLIEVDEELEALLQVDAPQGKSPPQPQVTAGQPDPGLRLVGAETEDRQAHWQAWARLRLWWQAPQGLEERLKVSARMLEPGGRVIGAVDAEPVAGAYPTTAWPPGQTIADAYEIPLPAGTPPGDYQPVVIIYDPDTGTERGRVELAPVRLSGNPARPPRRTLEASLAETIYARFGDVELLGFTPPDPAVSYHPGETLPVTLLWQARGRPAGDLRLAFWLEGESVQPLDPGGNAVLGGSFPAHQWQDGQVVRQWPSLPLPLHTPLGTYRLKMRVLRDGLPVPWGRWLLPLGSDLDLGQVQIAP